MFWIILSLILTIIILKIGLDVKIKDINKIKEIGYDKDLNKITNKLPENEEVCKSILKMLNNSEVKIEKEENSKTSLYMVMQNKIIIGNIKDSFTRIQTIAHECIHSIQDKRMLKFNFIFSNIYILYFLIACILAIFNVVDKDAIGIILIVQILSGIIYFTIRSFLEIDAMTRAPFFAEKYIENSNILSKEERKLINEKYEEINKIGIKLYIFTLGVKCTLKTLILSILITI